MANAHFQKEKDPESASVPDLSNRSSTRAEVTVGVPQDGTDPKRSVTRELQEESARLFLLQHL